MVARYLAAAEWRVGDRRSSRTVTVYGSLWVTVLNLGFLLLLATHFFAGDFIPRGMTTFRPMSCAVASAICMIPWARRALGLGRPAFQKCDAS